jgi:hypothetical protein
MFSAIIMSMNFKYSISGWAKGVSYTVLQLEEKITETKGEVLE